MPVIVSAILFLREGRALAVLRKLDRVPFGGRWLLPWTAMGEETAEEALRRHAREDFGVEVREEEFVDTLYLDSAGERFIHDFRLAGIPRKAARLLAGRRWEPVGEILRRRGLLP